LQELHYSKEQRKRADTTYESYEAWWSLADPLIPLQRPEGA